MNFRNMIFVAALIFAALSQVARGELPLKVCLISGSAEYRSDETLADYQRYLESHYNAQCTLIKAVGFDQLPGTEALADCDVALFFTRRLTITGEPLDRVKAYVESGRPIVAIRTASHGFQNWLEFDAKVLGGNYHNHFPAGPTTTVQIDKGAANHPLMSGIVKVKSRASLYRTGPIAADATLLMSGRMPGSQGPHPAAWTREYKGGRVFYTSLGAPEDFENATFRRLVANALLWTARREVVGPKEPEIPALPPKAAGSITLKLRTREEIKTVSGEWHEKQLERTLPLGETAILICDMWDKHWCRGATERVGELATKMDSVLRAARDRGIQIVHAPSETMDYYADWPQRWRMQNLAAARPDEAPEVKCPPLPIDDSDGGCDTDDTPQYEAWSRQHPGLSIGENDGISDKGSEVYNLLAARGIKNVIFMGVHTNMCVLGRSFAIRQMKRWGLNCILARDLTDAMYDPKDRPFVPHAEGTGLVVEYIEKYYAPSLTSDDLLTALR